MERTYTSAHDCIIGMNFLKRLGYTCILLTGTFTVVYWNESKINLNLL